MATFLTPVSPVLGSAESVSNVTASNSVPVGQLWGDVSGNQYVYCYNAGTTQISQGQFGVIVSGASGYSVTVTNVIGQDIAVGLARNATLTTATYGWLMYKGFAGLSTDNASGATNQVLAIGSLGNLQVLTAAAGSFSTAQIVGRLLVSVATGVTNAGNAWFNF